MENFSLAGASVAILTATMRDVWLILAAFAAASTSAHAESWSVGGRVGPFIFGHFVERTASIRNETGTATTTSRLSAETRAGAEADIERSDLNDELLDCLDRQWLGVGLAAWSSLRGQTEEIVVRSAVDLDVVVSVVLPSDRNAAARLARDHGIGGNQISEVSSLERQFLDLRILERGRSAGAAAVIEDRPAPPDDDDFLAQ